jgi:hypothetical protein
LNENLTIVTPVLNPGGWLDSYKQFCCLKPMDVHIIVVHNPRFYDPRDWKWAQDRLDITVLVKKDTSMYDAINIGLSHVNTTYVTYLNIDDLLTIDYLRAVLHLIQRDSFDLCYCNYSLLYTNGLMKNYNSLPPWLLKIPTSKQLFTSQQGIVWRLTEDRFDASLKYCGDTEFFLRYIRRHKRLKKINSFGAIFRIHNNMLSMDKKAHRLEHVSNIGISIITPVLRMVFYLFNYKLYIAKRKS